MQKEDLLKPRYKVIADYPSMERYGNYKVGDILTDDDKGMVFNQNNDAVFVCEWNNFPHLFKKLEWWEERDEKDLPKYIKKYDGQIFKIKEWTDSTSSPYIFVNPEIHKGFVKTCTDTVTYLSNDDLPATKEEYEQFKNNQ